MVFVCYWQACRGVCSDPCMLWVCVSLRLACWQQAVQRFICHIINRQERWIVLTSCSVTVCDLPCLFCLLARAVDSSFCHALPCYCGGVIDRTQAFESGMSERAPAGGVDTHGLCLAVAVMCSAVCVTGLVRTVYWRTARLAVMHCVGC